jgi:phosphoenolpyruvate phosphomutase
MLSCPGAASRRACRGPGHRNELAITRVQIVMITHEGTFMSKRLRLRELLRRGTVARAVGAHDALTAKLVEEAGFEAVWVSSFELSASRGVPDANLVTMSEYLDIAENIDASVAIPVLADCDTGFGGPLNVACAVRRYERRGIAGICVEDKVFPKINSYAAIRQDLVSIKEFTEKIVAAKEQQSSPDFVFVARTEALIAGLGIAEALERAYAYAEVGADAILVHSKSTRPDQIFEFAAQWDASVPLIAVPTSYADVDEKALTANGIGLVIYANHTLRAAVRAVRETLAELGRAGCAAAIDTRIAGMAEVFALQGMTVAYRTEA